MIKKHERKVPLALTENERKLILEDLEYIEGDYASVIRATPSDEPVRLTLEDWTGLGDWITAETSQARDRRLKKELNRLDARIRGLLEDRTSPTTLKIYRGEEEQVREDTVKLPEKGGANDED
jgi:hypothetical protein